MSDRIQVVGHRGWPTRFPDNSLAGFLAAARVSDAVELDVRRSKDGKLVLSHDPTIGGFVVADTDWEVLAEMDLGEGSKPCLLDEALSALSDTPALIEIKNSPGEIGFEPDHRLALESADRARPFDSLISFNWSTADTVRRVFPDLRTGVNVGLLGDLDQSLRHSLDVGHRLVVPHFEMVLAGSQALADGPEVFVWSNKKGETYESSGKELVSRGVSGIITDDPQITRESLRSQS